MTAHKNVSVNFPMRVFNQIVGRADLTEKSRNDEMRSLLHLGLAVAGDGEIVVHLPEGPKVRKAVWLDAETVSEVRYRSQRFHRSFSREVLLLIVHGLQTITDHDLATIQSMLLREGRAAP